MSTIKIKSLKDQSEHVIPRDTIMMSQLISDMLNDEEEDDEEDKEQEQEEVLIPVDVSGPILKKVFEFCTYSKEHPEEYQDFAQKIEEKPIKSKIMSEVVPKWYADYIDAFIDEPKENELYKPEQQEVLFNLILAANYLHISSLLNFACAKVATMMKGRTAEEIRKHFNIQPDEMDVVAASS